MYSAALHEPEAPAVPGVDIDGWRGIQGSRTHLFIVPDATDPRAGSHDTIARHPAMSLSAADLRDRRLAVEERRELADRAHQRGRHHHERVLVDADLDGVCSVRSCRASGWDIIVSDAPSWGRGERLALGGDDLRALLALGLGLLGHRALHRFGQQDVLQLDEVTSTPQSVGRDVEDLADVRR